MHRSKRSGAGRAKVHTEEKLLLDPVAVVRRQTGKLRATKHGASLARRKTIRKWCRDIVGTCSGAPLSARNRSVRAQQQHAVHGKQLWTRPDHETETYHGLLVGELKPIFGHGADWEPASAHRRVRAAKTTSVRVHAVHGTFLHNFFLH
jgi:hypothetical protein